MQHSEIPHTERKVIINLMHLGCNILNEVNICRGGSFGAFFFKLFFYRKEAYSHKEGGSSSWFYRTALLPVSLKTHRNV